MRIPTTMYSLLTLLCLAPGLSLAGEGRQQLDRERAVGQARETLDTLQSRSHILRSRSRAFRPVVGIVLGAGAGSEVKIVAVTPQGAAGEAGVLSGDVLASVDGNAVSGTTAEERIAHARALLANLSTDKSVTLGLTRNGKAVAVPVKPRAATTLSLVDNLQLVPEDIRQIIVHPRTAGTLALPAGAGEEEVRLDIIRSLAPTACKGDDCGTGLLGEVLRWNNLNLIQLEPELGRYFGTDRGVLVVSAAALPGLKAGDVILAIEGTSVATPQEAMRAFTSLSRKPGDAVKARVLRDHKEQSLDIKVPERMSHARFIPTHAVAPRVEAVPHVTTRRHVILVDADGNVRTLDDADGTAPPTPKTPPAIPL